MGKAALTITADSASRAYGGRQPAFGGKIDGLLDGDEITATYASAATKTSPANDVALDLAPRHADRRGPDLRPTSSAHRGRNWVGSPALSPTTGHRGHLHIAWRSDVR